jgi:DUF218 domain
MKMSRTNNRRLPDSQELSHILEIEADRVVPADKTDVHYPEFNTIVNFLKYLKLDASVFSTPGTIHQVVEQGRVLLDQVAASVINNTQQVDKHLLDDMWDYLSEEDEVSACDTVFVFGAKTPLRAIKAAEAFDEGRADRIVVSGGGPIYVQDKTVTEAENYKQILLDKGVPEDKIILEVGAITVPDNVRRSLNLLDELSISPKKIVLVNSPYSQRRGWVIFMKHAESGVSLVRVNCESAITKDNWFKSEDTLRIVLNEFVKMRASVVHNTA